MYDLNFLEIFTKEDIEFNHQMVDEALKLQGKIKKYMFQNRNYDFSSEILSEFRRKWGISE